LEYFKEYFVFGEEFFDDFPLLMPLPLISHLNSALIIEILLFSPPECSECMIGGVDKCIRFPSETRPVISIILSSPGSISALVRLECLQLIHFPLPLDLVETVSEDVFYVFLRGRLMNLVVELIYLLLLLIILLLQLVYLDVVPLELSIHKRV
jgi:hypothetical protein